MLLQLADERYTYEVGQHFTSLKWHVRVTQGKAQVAGSHTQSGQSCSMQVAASEVSTLGRSKQRRNWVIPVTEWHKMLAQVYD